MTREEALAAGGALHFALAAVIEQYMGPLAERERVVLHAEIGTAMLRASFSLASEQHEYPGAQNRGEALLSLMKAAALVAQDEPQIADAPVGPGCLSFVLLTQHGIVEAGSYTWGALDPRFLFELSGRLQAEATTLASHALSEETDDEDTNNIEVEDGTVST